jgi:hypothetical protein
MNPEVVHAACHTTEGEKGDWFLIRTHVAGDIAHVSKPIIVRALRP